MNTPFLNSIHVGHTYLNITPSTIPAIYLPVTGEIEVLTAPLPVRLINFYVKKQ
ncbi:MAG: hypothetical protein ABI168_04905 [Ginsengibacter sp.]